jgi:peptide/nickel transport system substrate-binding protein
LGKPFVKRIEASPVGDDLAALKAGAIDAATASGSSALTPDALAPFRSDSAFGIQEQSGGITGLYWNLTKGGALADPKFHQACAKAIDRNDLVQRLLGGNGKPGNPGYLTPDHPYYAKVEQYPFDPAGANQLLDSAGYKAASGGTRQGPDGQPLRFQLLALAALAPVAEIVVGALKAIGVELTVRSVDQFPQVLQALSQGNYEMAAIIYGGNDTDPNILRAVFSSKSPKAFFGARGYVNPEFDDLAEKQRGAFDDGTRRQLVTRMQELVARDLPLLHLYYPTGYFIYRKAAFDQWPPKGGPDEKLVLVTGRNSNELTIRPTTG